jgi:hypothetical protein
VPREGYRSGRYRPPAKDASEETLAETAAATLSRLTEELRATKAKDLYAKRHGDYDARPAYAKRITELARAIEAARGVDLG